MHLRLSLLALLFCPMLSFAQNARDDLQSIRYLAFSASSHLLLHYNSNTGTSDPQHAEKYRADLQQLDALLKQTQSLELQAEGSRFQSLIDTLEQHRDEAVQLYPIWINPILESQARLDALADTMAADTTQVRPAVQALQRLSLNTQRLLLYYQTRAFGSLAVYIDDLKQGAPDNLDNAIRRDLSALQDALPEQSQALNKLTRNYHYIRGHLLQREGEFVPGSVAFYLAQIGAQSQQLAQQIESS